MKNRCFEYKDYLVSVILGLLFAVFMITDIWTQFGGMQIGLGFVIFAVCFLCCFGLILLFLYLRNKQGFSSLFFEEVKQIKGSNYFKEYFIIFGIILILQIPVIVGFYPGIFGYDGPNEIMDLFMTGQVSSHHPLIHQGLLYVCFKAAYALFADYNIGLLMYVVLQTVVMALCYAYASVWIHSKGLKLWGRVLVIAFLALNPYLQLLGINTTKDTIWSGLFLVVFIMLYDLLNEWNLRKAILLGLYGVLFCAFRNQGYYILLFVFLGILIGYRFKKKKVLLTLLITIIAGWFVISPLTSILGFNKGDSREMFSIPMQQIARVYIENENGMATLDEADKELIERMIDKNNLLMYDEICADNVKSGFRTDVFKANLSKYIKLYFRLGIDNPRAYVKSFLKMVSGFWGFEQSDLYKTNLYNNSFTNYNACEIYQSSKCESIRNYYVALIDNIDKIPFLRIVFSQALPVYLIFIGLAVFIYDKNKNKFLVFMLALGQWGICLLSPVMLIRYAMPLIVCIPIMLYMILDKNKVKNG